MGLTLAIGQLCREVQLGEGRASGIFGNQTPRFCEVPLHPSRLCHLRHPHPGVDPSPQRCLSSLPVPRDRLPR